MNKIAFALIYFALSAQNLAYSDLRHNSFNDGASPTDSKLNESQKMQADVNNQVVEISEESPSKLSISAEQEETSDESSSNEKGVSKSSVQVVSPNDSDVISHSQNDLRSLSTVDTTEGTRSSRRGSSTAKFSAVRTTPISTTIQPTSQADSQATSPASNEESTTQPKRDENLVSNGDENELKTKGKPDNQSLPTTAATTATEARLEKTTALITEKPETAAPPSTNDKKCKNRLNVKRCKRLRKYFRTINACRRIHAMRKYCKKYCGLCGRAQAKKAYAERKKRARKNCKDFSRVLCRRFSAFCRRDSKNGRTMRHYCKSTCEQC